MRFTGYQGEKKRLSQTVAMQKTNEIVAPKEISTSKNPQAGPAGYGKEALILALLSRGA
jgi:hypothetical protein